MSTKGDKTKSFICQEAYQVFAEKGFKEVTMKDICEQTGLSRGGLYRHYSNTEQIFNQIINDLMGAQEDQIFEKIRKQTSAKEILLEVLERYQSEMMDREHSLSIAIYEYYSMKFSETTDNALYDQYLESKKVWEALIQYGIKTKEFRNVDAAAVFDLIVFSYQGVRMYSKLMPISNEIPQHIISQIQKILLND